MGAIFNTISVEEQDSADVTFYVHLHFCLVYLQFRHAAQWYRVSSLLFISMARCIFHDATIYGAWLRRSELPKFTEMMSESVKSSM